MNPHEEIARRRTFAIISHPDAGKTTLTEKLLLYGGAIRQAGAVKARRASRHATSDWMEIEKQRGISVTTSVMRFDYRGYRINILDTPGHQDFSEDTYRTLVAADSAVMLIDAARGVQEQTIKLFEVCRLRHIPIFTFVNKMDRAGKDPFDLMAEIERVLGIHAVPVTWPIGTMGDFMGVYHRQKREIELFSGGDHGASRAEVRRLGLDDPRIPELLGEEHTMRLLEDLELLDVAGDEADPGRILRGEITPMFFGSAMNNFGVESFLDAFLQYTPPPAPRESFGETIPCEGEDFSGFIFKIQANMNPAHRDRIAFLRVCTGVFERGMTATQYGSGQTMRLGQVQAFMADERETVDTAYPGDIVGLFDPGNLRLGDTLYTGRPVYYGGVPQFAPENFERVSAPDSLKRKQFLKGMAQLSEEGAIQTFQARGAASESFLVGAVGELQFDVLRWRLQSEYGASVNRSPLPYRCVRWIAKSPVPPDELQLSSSTVLALDRAGRDVLLFENDWSVRWALEHNRGLELQNTADAMPA